MSNIGSKVMREINADLKIKTKNSQAMYVIQYDSVTTFLHETIDKFKAANKWTTFIGIEVTLIITLLTANFKNFVISGESIKGIFICATTITGIYLITLIVKSIKYRHSISINALCDEIEKKSLLVMQSDKKQYDDKSKEELLKEIKDSIFSDVTWVDT